MVIIYGTLKKINVMLLLVKERLEVKREVRWLVVSVFISGYADPDGDEYDC
jgi:hypothetical protein